MRLTTHMKYLLALSLVISELFGNFAWAQTATDMRFSRPWERGGWGSPSSFRRDAESAGPQSPTAPAAETSQTPDLRARFLSEPTLASISYLVHVVGEVRQPGTYRITASDRLQEVLQRAGGISEQGSIRNVAIRRKGARTKTYDVLRFQLFGELQHNPYLLDNDVVYVPLQQRAVQVAGSVRRPNQYELRTERSLAQVLALAGGASTGASPTAPVRVVRFVEGEKQVLEVPYETDALQAQEIMDGDVIFVPNVLTANRKFDYNVAKVPGDNVFYPSYEDRVFVLGGVNNPGPYPFNPYSTVNHYLTMAGGTTKLARTNRIKLITMEGKKRRIRKDDVATINPGDSIYVPEPRIAPEGWIGIVTGLATFGLSTTATVLSLSR